MIKVNQDSYWVKLAYPFKSHPERRDWELPRTTNVCSLFWRAARTLMFTVLIIFAASGLVAQTVVVMIMYPWEFVLHTVGALLFFAALFTLLYLLAYAAEYIFRRVKNSIPIEAFRGWKEKHCRIVKIAGVREWED